MKNAFIYAVLLALVLGVRCGGGKEEATPKVEPKAKITPKPLPKDIPSLKVLAEKGDAYAQNNLGGCMKTAKE